MKLIRYACTTFARQLPILSGFAANGLAMFLGLVAAPIYIRLLGIEVYGLVGFYVTLLNALQIFDFGISPTITRELARYTMQPNSVAQSRNLLRTLEVIYWCIGIVIGIVLWSLSSPITSNWLNAQNVTAISIEFSIRAMSILFFLQWPISFYQGGLIGLQRQGLVYLSNIIFSVAKVAGSLITLIYISNTIEAFFVTQVIISLLQIIVCFATIWVVLPKSPGHRTRFDHSLITETWRISVGIGSINLLGLVLIHIDRIVLSRLLTLEMFGYYSLAYTISRMVGMFPNAIMNYALPRFSQAIEAHDDASLKHHFHHSAQWLSAVLFPSGFLMIVGAPHLLLNWTHNSALSEVTAPVVMLLVAGNMMNHVMYPHYTLHLAYGNTRAWLFMTLGFVIAFVPLLLLTTPIYGMIGAAAVWALLNLSQIIVGLYLTHSRFIRQELRRWLVRDIGPSLILSGCLIALLLPMTASITGTSFIVMAGAICIVTFGACLTTIKATNWLSYKWI